MTDNIVHHQCVDVEQQLAPTPNDRELTIYSADAEESNSQEQNASYIARNQSYEIEYWKRLTVTNQNITQWDTYVATGRIPHYANCLPPSCRKSDDVRCNHWYARDQRYCNEHSQHGSDGSYLVCAHI